MVNIQLFMEFAFGYAAQAAAEVVAFARKSTLSFPCLAVITLISAAPSGALFTGTVYREMHRETFLRTSYCGAAFRNLKRLAADHAFTYILIIRPSRLKVTRLRTVLLVRSASMAVKLIAAYNAAFGLSRVSGGARRVIAFIPNLARSKASAFNGAIFPSRIMGIELTATFEASQHWHDQFPYRPYVRGCGQAVRLAVRAVHEAALAHSPIIPLLRIAGRFEEYQARKEGKPTTDYMFSEAQP